MVDDNLGFPEYCAYCQCAASGVANVPSLSGAWLYPQTSQGYCGYQFGYGTIPVFIQQFGSTITLSSQTVLTGSLRGSTLSLTGESVLGSPLSCDLTYSQPNLLSGPCTFSGSGSCTLSLNRVSSTPASGNAYNAVKSVGGAYSPSSPFCSYDVPPNLLIYVYQQESFIAAAFSVGPAVFYGYGALDSYGTVVVRPEGSNGYMYCAGALNDNGAAIQCYDNYPDITPCSTTLTCTSGACMGSSSPIKTVSGAYVAVAGGTCSLTGGPVLQKGSSISYFDFSGSTTMVGVVSGDGFNMVSISTQQLGHYCTGTVSGNVMQGSCIGLSQFAPPSTCTFTLQCSAGACSGTSGITNIAGDYQRSTTVSGTCPISSFATSNFEIEQRGSTFELDPRGSSAGTSLTGYIDDYGLFAMIPNSWINCIGFVSSGTMNAFCLSSPTSAAICTSSFSCSSGQCVSVSLVGPVVGAVVGSVGAVIIVLIVVLVVRRKRSAPLGEAMTPFRQM